MDILGQEKQSRRAPRSKPLTPSPPHTDVPAILLVLKSLGQRERRLVCYLMTPSVWLCSDSAFFPCHHSPLESPFDATIKLGGAHCTLNAHYCQNSEAVFIISSTLLGNQQILAFFLNSPLPSIQLGVLLPTEISTKAPLQQVRPKSMYTK